MILAANSLEKGKDVSVRSTCGSIWSQGLDEAKNFSMQVILTGKPFRVKS